MSENPIRKKKVLFVCIGNMIRSQMAEGFARDGGSAFVETYSAGLRHTGALSEEAVLVMREKGIDINGQYSKGLDDTAIGEMDYIVNMSGFDLDSFLPISIPATIIEWDIEDPLGQTLGYFRKTRDEIETKVNDLLRRIWSEDNGSVSK
ncbi:MAG: arsenate reductase ArsC [Candidatus Latescibacterota bacterium]|nr:MAG: arsenate reductase ArsC [Candidatus Latescibacterota bacterium]